MMSSDFQIDLDGGTTSSQIRTASDLSQQFSYLLGGISRVRAQVRSSTANVNHVNQIECAGYIIECGHHANRQ